MSNPALFVLILVFCVPVPILWFGWVWFYEPGRLTFIMVNYTILIVGTAAFVWAVGAPLSVVLLVLSAAAVGHLRMWVMDAFYDRLDNAQRRRASGNGRSTTHDAARGNAEPRRNMAPHHSRESGNPASPGSGHAGPAL